jgi:hypothetical protein
LTEESHRLFAAHLRIRTAEGVLGIRDTQGRHAESRF